MPMYQMNPTSLFSAKATNYALYRLVWGLWDENDPFTKELDHLVLQVSNITPGSLSPESMVRPLLESSYLLAYLESAAHFGKVVIRW